VRWSFAQVYRVGFAILVALGACTQGCVGLPHYGVRHAPKGTTAIVDSQTREPIESALVLIVTKRGQGPFDNIRWTERSLTDVYIYHPGDRVFLDKTTGFISLAVWKESTTQAYVLVTPGYTPKYLIASGEKVRKSDRVIWALRPIAKAASADILEELRAQLSRKELGRSIIEKWDSGYPFSSEKKWNSEVPLFPGLGPYPDKSIAVELSKDELHRADEYLALAIKKLHS